MDFLPKSARPAPAARLEDLPQAWCWDLRWPRAAGPSPRRCPCGGLRGPGRCIDSRMCTARSTCAASPSMVRWLSCKIGGDVEGGFQQLQILVQSAKEVLHLAGNLDGASHGECGCRNGGLPQAEFTSGRRIGGPDCIAFSVAEAAGQGQDSALTQRVRDVSRLAVPIYFTTTTWAAIHFCGVCGAGAGELHFGHFAARLPVAMK